jgi:hypothetical protein
MDYEKHAAPIEPDPKTKAFYVAAMRALDSARVPYVVGGGYAMAYYTGIARNTKDLDLFVKLEDRDRALTTLTAGGWQTEFFYPFWIAKAIDPSNGSFIDLLYNSGNGLCPVDDTWMTGSIRHPILGHPTRLVPAEEQLWSKAFVQDRDRFDGADVHHLILSWSDHLDWHRLLRRFTGHEPVLLAHLIMFRYAYPTEKHKVPDWVMSHLQQRAKNDPAEADPRSTDRLCRGPFCSQRGYLPDVHQFGFTDARLIPHGYLTPDEVAQLPPP